MPSLPYIGNGPYCNANSLSVIFGDAGPGPAVIEVLSGTPFGMSLQGDDLPYWGPMGWTPEHGLGAALELLGWDCDRTSGSAEQAVALAATTSVERPGLAGPVEMGLLPYIPGLGHAIGADHVVVLLGVEDGLVRAHDVQGFPYATVPVDTLLEAWRGDTFVYPCEPYVLRTGFRRERVVVPEDALRAALPSALAWLDGHDSGADAERLAGIVERNPGLQRYKYLVEFTVQGGARRLVDASALLGRIGATDTAGVLDEQARLVGGLQLPLVTKDWASAAALLRALAPTYARLRAALAREAGPALRRAAA